ncbi:MAG: hypothetical protein KBG24_11375 [Bacteroidia bacterium]|nr:hypothetical protein [Bacteroidia bacterium]MBP9724614.1 hypothetical protein [Bacteroidia bacterium]
MVRGLHNKYSWFQTFETDFTIDRFLREFKHHLIDKYVSVTSFDSGELHISDEEKEAGWQNVNNIPTSPAIKKDTHIPTAGFDEWYVFEQRPSTIKLTDVYINYSDFNLFDKSDLIKIFWQDIELNQPIFYVAGGDNLIIVTTDEKLKQDIEKYWC